jgi:anti-sigma factor RsiW
VHDLAAQDFALIGGRLDYIGGRNVAALVYRHRKHLINVFVWPADAGRAGPGDLTRDGYNLVAWTAGGMRWFAVSDLNSTELRQFAELLRGLDG